MAAPGGWTSRSSSSASARPTPPGRTASSRTSSATFRRARRRAARRPARPAEAAGDDGGWAAFVAVNVLLVAIWAFSGAGYFWPAWVIAWWGFALVMKSAASRRALVTASRVRRLRLR